MKIEHSARNDAQEAAADPAPSSPIESYVFASSRSAARPPTHRAQLSRTLRSIHANGATNVKSTILTRSPNANGLIPLTISPPAETDASSSTSDYFTSRPARPAPPSSHVQDWLEASSSASSLSPSIPSVSLASNSPCIATPSGFSPQPGVYPLPPRRNQADLSLTELFTFTGSFGRPHSSTSKLTLESKERRKQARASPALLNEGNLSLKSHILKEAEPLDDFQKPPPISVRDLSPFILANCSPCPAAQKHGRTSQARRELPEL